jgi:GNAT superfamily N-acetyltransferase
MSTTLMGPSSRPGRTARTVQPLRAIRAVRAVGLQPGDGEAAIAMLGRCSGTTLRRRFHGVTDGVRYVTSLIGSDNPAVGYGAWIDGQCVGIASLHLSERASAEMAVLVEDAWQRRGIGTALVAALATGARQRGLATLIANIHAEDDFLVAALARLGRTRTTCTWGVCTTCVDLRTRDAA